MTRKAPANGPIVYDPRGSVEADARPLARRPEGLAGLRLAVLDNTKWNAGKLLRKATELLRAEIAFGAVNDYAKESFSHNAAPELLADIAADNDIALTAVGD